MCLNKRAEPAKQRIIEQIPEEELVVYKVVSLRKKGKFSPIYAGASGEYKEGLNEADISHDIIFDNGSGTYKSGFHFFLTEVAAKSRYKLLDAITDYSSRFMIIECIVKKDWVTEVGIETEGIVIVAKKAIFPKFKK